jgi:ATP-dependent DNA helicase RecG
MTEQELKSYIQLQYPRENEYCEWKDFSSLKHNVSGHKGEDIISYVSAIANRNGGYLIIGVKDQSLDIEGIDNLNDFTPENLPGRLLGNCTNLSDVGLQVESYVTSDTQKEVWIIHIPKHTPRKPVYAHKTPWQRVGDTLLQLTKERETEILQEALYKIEDWSARICENATIDDLDEEAVKIARQNYKAKFQELSTDVDKWDDKTFLNKAKLTIHGKITRTAIILLGKTESEHFLLPAEAKIRWILKDKSGAEKDYQIFTCPLIISAEKVFGKIRNLNYRYIKASSLFPEEVLQYDPYIIRESLNNCIAHQDYEIIGRINVVEFDDKLVFSNVGKFIPGTVERVIKLNAPEERYRNPFLVTAMFNLKMVDSIGSGIRRMFTSQSQRFFPMPDYDFSEDKVTVSLIGKVLDLEYAKVLARNPDLTLEEIIILDKVQKRQFNRISPEEIKHVKEKGLIEGRKPNYYIAEQVAISTNQVGSYVKNRGLDNQYYKELIFNFIARKKEGASKDEIREFISGKLPDILKETQRNTKISNLLASLRKYGKIINKGSDTEPSWHVIKKTKKMPAKRKVTKKTAKRKKR